MQLGRKPLNRNSVLPPNSPTLYTSGRDRALVVPTFLGHMKDSLWSIDLFRCESATLRTHWVLVVMDQYTRRIIGFGVHEQLFSWFFW